MFPIEPFRALIGQNGPGHPSIVRIVPLTERKRRTPLKVRSELISQLDESLEALEMLKVGQLTMNEHVWKGKENWNA